MRFKFNILLLMTMTITSLFPANKIIAAEEGSQSVVTNTQSDEIGRRVALFDSPKGHSCTATMLTSNFGLTAAHCGNGFKEGSVGKVSPAQSARQTPFGSMNISLFNPYENKDIAIIYGKEDDKSGDYKSYQNTFAGNDLQLKGFTEEELKSLVGKKYFLLAIHMISMVTSNTNSLELSHLQIKILFIQLYPHMEDNLVLLSS